MRRMEVAMKLVLLGLASVLCGGIALMPLLVQPDPQATALTWLAAAMMAR